MSTEETIAKTPNPQGKGLVPVLAALSNASLSIVVPPKQVKQVSSELFTSLFVLESSFGFKPVIGRIYSLYRQQGAFILSLVAPKQWSAAVYGQYIGACELHTDLTWTLTLSDEASADDELMAYIAQRREHFEQELQAAASVDDMLPTFKAELPFYQRVFASALAGSLGASMQSAGIKGLSYDEAADLLEAK